MKKWWVWVELHSTRKGWGRSLTRWSEEDLSRFGIRPTAFGTWLYIIDDEYLSGMLVRRKPWAARSRYQRRERWVLDREGGLYR